MDFDEYGNNFANNDIIWQDEEYPGPQNDYNNGYQFNGRAGFRSGEDYGTNAPRSFSGPRGQGSGPRFFWGRGGGPAGPPTQHRFPKANDPISFLMRCGVLKQTLKGLPNVLLRLMEPQYCGVCAQGFDNFDGSRLHYISKKHIQNQKKWLTQQAEVGSHRSREIPLKSRELYCELCDVHITSTTHAESHYAGRPHRAIVEGRKLPKNPFLLQKGMQNRVEKLIRREKKSLKPVEESTTSEQLKRETNSIPTELYCGVCKASVTCTEQMTMHLNGKRHLKNEKQHILKMMKGGTNKPKPAETDTSKDAGAQAQGADETGEKNEDEFDWGHGSGTWDDDPQ